MGFYYGIILLMGLGLSFVWEASFGLRFRLQGVDGGLGFYWFDSLNPIGSFGVRKSRFPVVLGRQGVLKVFATAPQESSHKRLSS